MLQSASSFLSSHLPRQFTWMVTYSSCCSVWYLLNLLHLSTGAPQFCQHEIFNATCSPGHVVLMTSSMYGRMRVGRCIETDTAIGCSTNVLPYMDNRCSGRQWCAIHVSSGDLFAMQSCPKDLYAYLEADYECVKLSGQPLPGNDCSTGEMEVRGQNGYLHHIITVFSSPHPHCSWHLFVPQGQQIKVTLYEFVATFMPHLALAASQSLTSQGHGHVMGGRMTCPAYLVLRERGGEETHVCVHSGARQRHVYTAASSELFIRIDTQPQQHDTVNLLVKFEALGCADVSAMVNARIERVDRDTTVVTCVNSGDTSHLICKDNTWLGQLHNCSTALGVRLPSANETTRYRRHKMPIGLLVAVGGGVIVGVVMGCVSLLVAIYCKRGSVVGKSREPMMIIGGVSDTWLSGRGDNQSTVCNFIDLRPGFPQQATPSSHSWCPDVATVGGDYGVTLSSRRIGKVDNIIGYYSANNGNDYVKPAKSITLNARGGADGKEHTEEGVASDCQSLREINKSSSVPRLNASKCPSVHRVGSCCELHQPVNNVSLGFSHFARRTRTLGRDWTNRVTWYDIPSSER